MNLPGRVAGKSIQIQSDRGFSVFKARYLHRRCAIHCEEVGSH